MPNTAEVQIQIRRGTAADWTSNDPVLLAGEIGYETDTGFWKWGDGSTAWTALLYNAFFGGPVTVNGLLTVNGDISLTGLVDGRDINGDGTTQDNHIADSSIHFSEGSIDHTALQNIGVHTHADIDSFIVDAEDNNITVSLMFMGG